VVQKNKTNKTGTITEHQIDIKHLPSGTYFVQINSEKENQIKRILKE